MSIYSGFATRVQQNAYDQLIVDLIQVLQRRIIKFYVQQQADQTKFHNILLSLHAHFSKMEQNKYLQPKISNCFTELIQLTSSITKVQDIQSKVAKENNKNIAIQSKESLNFSTDKLKQNIKAISKTNIITGKIKHQLINYNNQEALSSRAQSNPQNSFQKKINPNFRIPPKQSNIKDKNYQKWSAIFDNPIGVQTQQQKKNVQYIIKEYISRGQTRRRHKKQNYIE